VSVRRTTSFSNRMLGLAPSNQSCPHMERLTSHIHQTGPTNHQEQDISCAILRGQVSVLAVHSRRPSQESVRLDLLMEWMVTAQHSQHLHQAQGRLLKGSPQARHCRWASTDSSMATLLTLERRNSQDSATSPTSPAQAQSMPHYQRRSLFKRQTVRLTMKALSWPGFYQGYTPSTQLRSKCSTQANYTDTPTKQRVV
jgi:hypothetical protein